MEREVILRLKYPKNYEKLPRLGKYSEKFIRLFAFESDLLVQLVIKTENKQEQQPKKTWIHGLKKKMSSIIHPQVPRKPPSTPLSSTSLPSTSLPSTSLPSTSLPSTLALESPKQRSFGLLRHHVPKFKINCAKYYSNENLVIEYCTQYLDRFPSSYSTLCDRAETFRKLKRYEEALNDLNCAIAVKPHKPTAWCLRGIIKGLNKVYMEAIEDLNDALYRDKTDYLALKWRAFCYYEIQFYNHALWDLDLIINSGYADGFTYLNRADINRRLKRFKDANEDIAKAFCFKNVNKALAYGISGELKLDREEFQDAINDLNKALKLQPDNAIALRNRCESYRIRLKRFKDANEDIAKAFCFKNVNKALAYGISGELKLDREEFQDAINDLNKALKLQPDNAIALRNRCESYRMLMDSENALEDLNKLCILEPENDYQYQLRGAILLDMRKWNDSLKNLNKAINSLPNNVVTIGNRAKLYCKLRQYNLALKDTQDGILIDPRNLIIRQQSMDLHRRNNQFTEAALMIDHENINTLLIRADVYFLKRRYNYSLADLDNANRIAPKNSFVLISRSELFCKMKYYEDALYNVQCALEIKSADHYALEVRGNIYRKQHKYEEALVDYNKSLELYPLDMILEHDQDGKKESCKVGGGKDDKDCQDLLVCRNKVGYDKGFVVTQQIFGERNFSRIYYQRGDTYYKLGMYELALKDFNSALELYPLDMILEHDQDGKKESCKVGGGKDDKDCQDLLVCRNKVGYDKGFVVTQQIFGERNFSRIYYQRGDTYYKLGMYELALKDFNSALELASGYAPIYKKRAYVLCKLKGLIYI
ncbi:hypothetical protein Glove_194g158 [Diversispora epigaea]|uniref:Uncharacterized protein n=1 Tax=Diversispora epigaea TaxID=1348612 RepID=A0A397IU36_9GLOM|nr:hypothetical protein Glove_194g158 [Diversispora epigaea]